MFNKTSCSVLSIGLVIIFSGCIAFTPSSDHETLIIQIDDIKEVDNRISGWLSDRIVARQYQGFLGLIAPGESIVTMPNIAESWTVNNNRTEWRFIIREGVKFHDGSSIDAKTVKYSIEANLISYYNIHNMSYAANQLLLRGMNISFPASDPNGNGRIVIFSGNWFPDPWFELDICGDYEWWYTLVPYGSHGSYSDTTETCQEKFQNFTKHPISAGPFKVMEHVRGDYVLLERFDDWFGWGKTLIASNGKNYTFPTLARSFKKVKFQIIQDKEISMIALSKGTVDMTTSSFPSESCVLEFDQKKEFSVFQNIARGSSDIRANIQGNWPRVFGGPGNYPVSEIWFRRAISHAVNRTKIDEVAFLGLHEECDSLFPDWLINQFPLIDTSDYYDFDQGLDKAITILDTVKHTALGFEEEPDNRFGWGIYANETNIDGVEQKKGRHFLITTPAAVDFSYKRALEIKKDLRQIGIYIDVEIVDWDPTYIGMLWEGDPGYTYNVTAPQPDLNFKGPHWDFIIGGWGFDYGIPMETIAYGLEFSHWFTGKRPSTGWYNENYEIAREKVWTALDWSPTDLQFNEGLEIAGYEMSGELPIIPLVWYNDIYVFNSHLRNFVCAHVRGKFMIAYTYWK